MPKQGLLSYGGTQPFQPTISLGETDVIDIMLVELGLSTDKAEFLPF